MTPDSTSLQPLAGSVILVTGASRGIGRSIAGRLLAEGARVIGTSTRALSATEALPGVEYVAVDFADSSPSCRATAPSGSVPGRRPWPSWTRAGPSRPPGNLRCVPSWDPEFSNWLWREQPLEPGPTVVFDMDGVLSDASSRQSP